MVQLNGKEIEGAVGKSLSTLVAENGFEKNRIAIEVNEEMISRKEWDDFIIQDQTSIEVVSFVGGG